jgi:hypothetical protein
MRYRLFFVMDDIVKKITRNLPNAVAMPNTTFAKAMDRFTSSNQRTDSTGRNHF